MRQFTTRPDNTKRELARYLAAPGLTITVGAERSASLLSLAVLREYGATRLASSKDVQRRQPHDVVILQTLSKT